jgi:NTP pyrophosphatase (non-canonical NTP hydrolase)
MSEIQKIVEALVKFRDERDWKQFHNGKDLALAISVEAGELLELYLWKDSIEVSVDKVKEELADVLAFTFLLAEKYNLDISKIMMDKIEINNKKYPVQKSKGTAKKYDEL